MVDVVSTFGYSMTIWIPVAVRASHETVLNSQLLSIPPFPFARLVFAVLGFGVSLAFLLRKCVCRESIALTRAVCTLRWRHRSRRRRVGS